MTDVLGHISASMTIAQGLYEIIKTYNNSVLIKHVSDLNIQLAKAQDDAALMMSDLRELRSQNQEDIDNPLTISQCGIYFDAHKNRYCAGCYDGPTKRRVHLAYQNANSEYVSYLCPVCKIEYKDKDNIGLVHYQPQKAKCSPLDD